MDIREYMTDHGLSQKKLAEAMNISTYSVCTRMKKELTQKEKEEWLRVIDSIWKDEEPGTQEESEDLAEEQASEGETQTAHSTRFQIGDRVKIPSRNETVGIVEDIWHSLLQNKVMYNVSVDGGSMALYAENQLEPAPLPITYSFGAHIDGNVAVVTMKAEQDGKEWVYARGHAHIIHDGEVGMAQAISYAARRMFESLDVKQKDRIYLRGEKDHD